MSEINVKRWTGWFFIAGALLVNIPYTLLITSFDYPDILRMPVEQILTRFQAGGSGLIFTWLAFAWVGLPLLLGAVMLKRALADEHAPFLETATTIGVTGFVAQVVGLLRWVFVVPLLARQYVDPASGAAAKAAMAVVFMAVHQYGGVVLGEHIGQFFTVVWMSMVSAILFRSARFPKWLAWLGWVASGVYLLAQGELLATVMPGFPVVGWAGLVGSLLWLAWMLALGIVLARAKEQAANRAG